VLAPDLSSAAQSVAAVGLSCGDCHTQMRRGTAPAAGQDALAWEGPPEDLEQRMARHEHAAELLWRGLIDPSESAWLNGTVTLTRAPLHAPLRDGEVVSPAMAEQMEAIRVLAKRARVASSHPDRASIYGELIARCAGCHFVAGVK
jgi:mono/diheme cytochrome c family protein